MMQRAAGWSWRAGAILVALVGLLTTPAAAQQGPRPLFPALSPTAPAPALPSTPAVRPARTRLPAGPTILEPSPAVSPIQVESLAPPTLAALGLASAQDELGGLLWPNGAPEHLAILLDRLPVEIAEPTLRSLQRALLAAPGPGLGAPREIFFRRVERLLAMGEADAALEVLALIPDGSEGLEVEALRLRARLAADRIEEACTAADTSTATGEPWPEARLLCAALRRDVPAVALALDLFRERGQRIEPTLAGLAGAYANGDRYKLTGAMPADPLLLPLLRRAMLDVTADTVARLPPNGRRALGANPNLATAIRNAAGGPVRPGPSIRPTLAGHEPADWVADIGTVPAPQRASYFALLDGLGLEVPEPAWAELGSRLQGDAFTAPELFLWRGLERAVAAERRGEALLYTLLLLDGRPEITDPVGLRAALQVLRGVGLAGTAKALAAGTGGALGL